jgi:putative endonuclease
MYYVYLIQSIAYPHQTYIGYTENLKERLSTHNSGGSTYTTKYRPWELVFYLGLKSKIKALEFERYLKSPSGRAFASKRLFSS